jgi:hypothetical protein
MDTLFLVCWREYLSRRQWICLHEEEIMKAPNSDRRCRKCGAKLSQYNDDTFCFPCQEKRADLGTKYWVPLKQSQGLTSINSEYVNFLRAKTNTQSPS